MVIEYDDIEIDYGKCVEYEYDVSDSAIEQWLYDEIEYDDDIDDEKRKEYIKDHFDELCDKYYDDIKEDYRKVAEEICYGEYYSTNGYKTDYSDYYYEQYRNDQD
jgi:hypothetical protein